MKLYRVALFARYAELLGQDQCDVTIPGAATVETLIDAVRRLPGGDQLPSHPLVAVNRSLSHPLQPLLPTDEIALLPPMAGG